MHAIPRTARYSQLAIPSGFDALSYRVSSYDRDPRKQDYLCNYGRGHETYGYEEEKGKR